MWLIACLLRGALSLCKMRKAISPLGRLSSLILMLSLLSCKLLMLKQCGKPPIKAHQKQLVVELGRLPWRAPTVVRLSARALMLMIAIALAQLR